MRPQSAYWTDDVPQFAIEHDLGANMGIGDGIGDPLALRVGPIAVLT